MKIFLLILASILILTLQMTILPRLSFLGVMPNLLLVLVITLAILQKEENFKWWLLGTIFVFDVLISQPFGFVTLASWLSFYLISWLAKFLFKQTGFLAVAALIVIGILIFEALFIGLLKVAEVFHLAGGQLVFLDNLAPLLLITLFYNGIFGLLIFYPLRRSYLKWIT